MLAIPLLLLSAASGDSVGQVPYSKLETREATRQAMLEQLTPDSVAWGRWYQCSPFPYAGHGQDDLATSYGPEAELAGMRRGEAPDLERVYAGKDGHPARWVDRGLLADTAVDLHIHEEEELQDLVRGYLYTTVESPHAQTIEYTMGSDDGLRVWLNGELLHSIDVPRGLDPASDTVRFDFEEGTNDLLFEVVDGYGGWAFQINTRRELDPRSDAQLQFLLDRDFPPSRERAHYRVMTVPVPRDVVLEVGGLDVLPDGRPAVTTRRGEVYLVEDAYDAPPLAARFVRFADGLHEPLGVAWREDGRGLALDAVQRGELTRLVDLDGDLRADLYETLCDDWGVSGNYHEFAFGPEYDREGNAWVTLNVGFCGALGKSTVPYRGWALRIAPDGTMTPWCDGLRSPNGIGVWKDGEVFYVDNQGDYVATNKLSHLARGSWHGHPASLRWRDDVDSAEDERPPRQPASIWFPYRKMGQSAADIALDTTGGAFGPFAGQFFVGDQTLAEVMRVDLERVKGHYQGACFPFLGGLDCGVNRVAFAPDGSMFVGQTDRGWGSVGRKRYGLQRIEYTGEVPFEIQRMSARSDGFVLEFTQDVDRATAGDPASYSATSYTYEYHADYGAPEDDAQELEVLAVDVLGPRTVRVHLSPMRAGYVHELHVPGVRNLADEGLLHEEAYYTLIEVPEPDPGALALRGTPAAEIPRVLFLTHSAGYVHDVVRRPSPDQLALAERELIEAARDRLEVIPRQDCAELTPERLAGYDAVVFYTTGELPIPDEHKRGLVDWVAAGGAFVGVHCATDTFYEYPPYQEMLGGVFDGHPWHEEVTLRVEDRAHPACAALGESLELVDEIYQFREFRRYPNYPLLSLTGEHADLSKGKRADGDYVNAWFKDWGEGRVFYTALGHRAEVWEDERFREHLVAGIVWAIDGETSPQPPEDAARLLEGDLEAWCHADSSDARWDLAGGVLTVRPGSGDVFTRERFGDGLYHIEFSPSVHDASVSGQARGNSGVYLMGQYELQILDSFGLEPGPGDCGACYGIAPPRCAPYRPAGEWSTYDIEFQAPRFSTEGVKVSNARVTAWLNGRLIHDDLELPAPTGGAWRPDEFPLGPLRLQDHGNTVRFRNIWVLPR